jgi:hypothetical protein
MRPAATTTQSRQSRSAHSAAPPAPGLGGRGTPQTARRRRRPRHAVQSVGAADGIDAFRRGRRPAAGTLLAFDKAAGGGGGGGGEPESSSVGGDCESRLRRLWGRTSRLEFAARGSEAGSAAALTVADTWNWLPQWDGERVQRTVGPKSQRQKRRRRRFRGAGTVWDTTKAAANGIRSSALCTPDCARSVSTASCICGWVRLAVGEEPVVVGETARLAVGEEPVVVGETNDSG